MAFYRCQMCGGELSKNKDGSYICLFCETVQTFQTEIDINNTSENIYAWAMQAMANGQIENAIRWFSSIPDYSDSKEKYKICLALSDEIKRSKIYSDACSIKSSSSNAIGFQKAAELFLSISDYKDSERLYSECMRDYEIYHKDEVYRCACKMMSEHNIYFLTQAAKLFASIADWKDAIEMKEQCLLEITTQRGKLKKQKEVQRLNIKRKKRISCVVAILLITAIALFFLVRAERHSVENIQVEIISTMAQHDKLYYYVYMDCKLNNNTDATLDYIKFTTYFTYTSGKPVGTMTTELGSLYEDDGLSLKSKQSITKETYLSEYQLPSSDTTLFAELYNNGIEGLTITYEITYAKWLDGYIYKK